MDTHDAQLERQATMKLLREMKNKAQVALSQRGLLIDDPARPGEYYAIRWEKALPLANELRALGKSEQEIIEELQSAYPGALQHIPTLRNRS